MDRYGTGTGGGQAGDPFRGLVGAGSVAALPWVRTEAGARRAALAAGLRVPATVPERRVL